MWSTLPHGLHAQRERLRLIRVLTYNVAGLPDSISSAPTPREPATTEIGRRIEAYDIVHVQEDFNYHARLYAADTIAEFAAANALTDAWVGLIRDGTPPTKGSDALVCDQSQPTVPNTCEVVDKVLYRGSRLVSLNATSYNNEHAAFLTGDGLMLSDHDPVAVRFSWSRNPDFRLSEQFGGPHGDRFNDIDSIPAGARATTITLSAGSRIDRLAITLDNGTTLTHGGTGGTAASLTLGSGEYVTTAHLCRAQKDGRTRIFDARFSTNLGHTHTGEARATELRGWEGLRHAPLPAAPTVTGEGSHPPPPHR
ncbi:jacalin-like lectin [Streptomyces sp. NPDC059534]|uniref:jacalin-like lectin n=1 Tax=Streptomyces sp. NPDC059534 TaxID=3346859 RepID=UPI0036CEE8FE